MPSRDQSQCVPDQATLQAGKIAPPRCSDVQPLVSVVAIAYNNATVILETLESIRRQDYARIELIVSDDGSVDGTPTVVERWLKQHSNRFHGSRLLTSSANEGISRNVANGIAASRGSWIKPIACDDILCDDAISKFLEQTKCDGSELAFSQITKFRTDGMKMQVIGNLLTNKQQIDLIEHPSDLLRVLRTENFLPAPGCFYSRRLFEAAGGIDTRFKHLDDWPLWLRMLPHVQRVSWIDKPLVLYRISDQSVSQKKKAIPIGTLLYADRQQLYRRLQRPHLTDLKFWHLHLQMLRQRITFEVLGGSLIAYRLLMPLQLLSPLAWRGMFSAALQVLNLVRKNAVPLARGAYYFGMSGLRNRVRVFGAIDMAIPRSRINIGQRVVIFGGATLVGKNDTGDTINIGSFSILERNSYINAHGGSVVIGEHVHVGVGCVLQGYGGLEVGDNTMLGPYVQVYTSNHRTSSPSLPRYLLGEKTRPVTIGRNCWIAANCIVLPGVCIPDESVLPASEVVRRKAEAVTADVLKSAGGPRFGLKH